MIYEAVCFGGEQVYSTAEVVVLLGIGVHSVVSCLMLALLRQNSRNTRSRRCRSSDPSLTPTPHAPSTEHPTDRPFFGKRHPHHTYNHEAVLSHRHISPPISGLGLHHITHLHTRPTIINGMQRMEEIRPKQKKGGPKAQAQDATCNQRIR